jgi:hypothetical protein
MLLRRQFLALVCKMWWILIVCTFVSTLQGGKQLADSIAKASAPASGAHDDDSALHVAVQMTVCVYADLMNKGKQVRTSTPWQD